MNRSLFTLISKAGRVSLDELRARSSVEESALSRELVTMVREGVIDLFPNPDLEDTPIVIEGDSDATTFLQEFLTNSGTKGPVKSVHRLFHKEDFNFNTSMFADAIDGAFQNERTASALMVSPTSWGFKVTS